MESRELTAAEVREQFLQQVRCVTQYWSELPDISDQERCEGVAFSILNIIDGFSCLPSFDLVVRPHHYDKQFHINEGENYYPDGVVINECMLHEHFFKEQDD